MLVGKKFPMNLVVNVVKDMYSYIHLNVFLDEIATNSLTTKHWAEILIRSIFIAVLFSRAEREGEWPLHLSVVKSMPP